MDYSRLPTGEWVLQSGARILFDRNQRPLRVCRDGVLQQLLEVAPAIDRDRAPGAGSSSHGTGDQIEPSLDELGPLHDGDQIELIRWFRMPGVSIAMATIAHCQEILESWPDAEIEIARTMDAGLYQARERQLVQDEEPSAEDRRLARNARARSDRAKVANSSSKEAEIVTRARNLTPEARLAMLRMVAPDELLDLGIDEICSGDLDLRFYASLETE